VKVRGFERFLPRHECFQKSSKILKINGEREAVMAVIWHEEEGYWLAFDMINNKKWDNFNVTNV